MDRPTRRMDDPDDEPSDAPTRRLDRPPPMPAAEESDEPGPPCADCGGETIWAESYVANGFRVRRLVGNSIWHGNEYSYVDCRPLVCLSCGLVKFYTNQPQRLLGDQ